MPLLIGALAGFVATVVGLPLGLLGLGGLPWTGGVGGSLAGVVDVALQVVGWLPLVAGIGFLFWSRTRLWGAGVLIGVAVSWIVGFAACVVLLAVVLGGSGVG
ncbi:MAG: hypothetical protein AVDCRST_MAG72-1986 [uncultured Nocardioidaceae bacterium]|uniref:Uncharacterized protein n=1 Tax=uncultured Nocardioidaceae bacterium TaxID=253824 RepID=A0A6J4MFI7_9ACTN|nr:MAG: hypothetical protein AVDCRST_MAG72-1986 [uncultured Nocardioidaceae bacterium]